MTRRIASALAYTLLAAIVALALTVTITTGIFWAVMACVAVASLVVLTYYIRQALAENDAQDDLYAQDVLDYYCAGNGHEYEAVDGDWVCAHCGDVVRQPLNCGGLHRYIETRQSLLCTVCGHRTALPYDQTEESA
jgi:hypothetical protein